MFQLRHFLLVTGVGLCCAAQFALHSCATEDPLAAVSSVAMAQTPDLEPELELQAKGKDKDRHKKPKKGALALASALCVGAMQAGMANNMTAETLGQYCVDLALELLGADYTLDRKLPAIHLAKQPRRKRRPRRLRFRSDDAT